MNFFWKKSLLYKILSYICKIKIQINLHYYLMRRFQLLLGLSLASFLTLQAQTVAPKYSLADGEAYVYGQLRYDTRERTYGLMGFQTDAPSSYSLLKDYGTVAGQTPILTAGTYVGDTYYAYETTLYANVLMPKAIVEVNTATGTYATRRALTTAEGETPLILDEMTYDPKTATLLGMHYDTEAGYTYLYEIDKETLEITYRTYMQKAFYTMTADNGQIYGIVLDDNGQGELCSFPVSDIKNGNIILQPKLIGGTGITVGDYSQSMEFDKSTHRLWWVAQAIDDNVYLVELDPKTGAALSKTQIAGAPQVLAMGIPYEYAADGAPSYVRNLTATAAAQGALSASLTWTMPATDYLGSALASLDGVKIYRNGQLVETTTATTWTDAPAEDGLYIYKVVPYNGEGDGIAKERRIFVGVDLPGAPTDVTLSAVESKATVSWSAPTTGANGGYFDSESLAYEVVRKPDNVTIATHLTATSIEDEVAQLDGYSYVVTSINKKGRGNSAISNTLAFGPATGIPFTSPLRTQDDFNRWTIIDGNGDQNTWSFNQHTLTTTYDRNEQDADDWLVSPALSFDKDKIYQLRYTYSTANWVSPDTYEPVMEKMKVWFGAEPTKSGLTTLIKDLDEFHTASYTYLYGKDVFQPSESGTAYFGFQACSDAEHGQIYLADVSLREYSATDLSVRSMTGSTLVNAGVAQTYTVTVGNEGSASVSNYKVQVINAETNEVLGESQGKAVAKDGTVDVPVTWTPAAEGVLTVTARVVLSGDTYPEDNVLASPIEVKVNAADADRWITLNTDDSYGWRMPFWLYSSYARVQSIFYEKELQQKNINITGLRFLYNCKEAQTIPVRISIKPTDSDNLMPFGATNAAFEEDDFTVVFEGDVAVKAGGQDQELEIKLTTPYLYKEGNLNVMFETLMGSNVYQGSNHPEWHFCEPEDRSRSAYYSGDSSVPVDTEVYASDFTPYVSISYTDASNGIGDVRKSEDASVVLTNLSGHVVYAGKEMPKLDAGSLPRGVYILKSSVNGTNQTSKVVLR